MPNPLLIGLTGFKSSGKDTTCGIIYNETATEVVVERRGFADALKLFSAAAFGLAGTDEAKLEWANAAKEEHFVDLYDEYGDYERLTFREFFQNVGLAARDQFGENCWIDQVLPDPPASYLRAAFPGVDLVVITDLRFENEADRVKQLGGAIWEVQRPGLEPDGHLSEEPLPRKYIDRVINNSGDIVALTQEVQAALKEVGL